MNGQRKIRVAVVFGGRGPEHPVSCMGGGNILRAIDRSKYDVVPIGITTEGHWVQVADEPDKLAIEGDVLPSVEAAALPGAQVVPWSGTESALAVADTVQAETVQAESVQVESVQAESVPAESVPAEAGGLVASAPAHIPQLFGDVDVVWPVLHGPYGEDGTIQGLLEMADVPYIGAGVLASAVSMDKEYMKLIFKSKGLPVGPYVVVHERDWPTGAGQPTSVEAKRVQDDIAELGWPLFVKPARGGSSIGTSKAGDIGELHEAIALARAYDPKVLVEAAVDGVEVEVSVLQGIDDGPPDTSLPGQLLVNGGEEFWDFEAKYLDSASGMAIPAPIPDGAIAEIRRLAAAAFEAVSCEGLARVDFFYTSRGEVLINEINTMPGLSPASYFQKMWEASGVTFAEVIDRLIAAALSRRPGLR